MHTQKKSLVWVNFFRQKVLLWPKKNSHLVGRAQKIAFSPLNYDQKVEFCPFLAFLACCMQHCIHFRACALVQLASLESSTPFMRVVRYGSPYGVLEGRYKNSCCNYHSYVAANTIYLPPTNFSSLLNTPNSFIWLEGHLKPIYLEEITKIEPFLIHSSQFW